MKNNINKIFIRSFISALILFISSVSFAFIPLDENEIFKQSLNGYWRFTFNSSRPGFEKKHYDDSDWPVIEVPSNWELCGFEEPKYAKPRKGTALYRKTFNLPKNWTNRTVMLRFEAVAFGFEFWVNGKHAGEFNKIGRAHV